MKLTIIILMVTIMHVTAASYAQDVSLNVKNTPVKEVLRQLTSQTGYNFICDAQIINELGSVTIKVKNAPLNKVLKEFFNSRPVEIIFGSENTIIIRQKIQGAKPIAVLQTISGKITDNTGQTLPGVSVKIKGTNKGTVTDADGNYRLDIDNPGAVLIFTSVGYVPQEISVNGQKTINLQLVPEPKSLSDVVVVGYGTQKRSDLTGAVGSINAAAIQQAPANTLEQAMQGKIAGVQIQQSSGQPGAGISIRVRGATSIAGGNEPLYVIDGIPQYNTDVRSSNILSSINPNDIQSIEVLKDASSTAIYGSRGANGVVLVTTKSGVSGRSQVSFDSYVGIQTPRKKLDLMTGDQFVAFNRQLYANSNQPIPADLATVPNANTNWQDVLLKNAFQQNHNLSFSGGSDKTTYLVSMGLLEQNGIVKNSNYSRGSLRFNLDSKLSDIITIQTHLFASRGVENGFVASDGTNVLNFGKSGIGSMLIIAPTVSADNPNGYSSARPYTFSPVDVENPLAIANEALNKSTITRFQGGTDFKVTIIKGLVNTTRIGYDYLARRNDIYYPKVLLQLSSGIGLGQLGQNENLGLLAEDFLEYKKDITENLTFEGIAGGSYQTQRDNISFLQGSNYFTDNLKDYNFSAAGSTSKPQTDVIKNTIISVFARMRLNYKDRYLLAGSIRRDGVSVFSVNNKYGVFPTVSAGWNIHNESFFKI